jgi:hypothetical protein
MVLGTATNYAINTIPMLNANFGQWLVTTVYLILVPIITIACWAFLTKRYPPPRDRETRCRECGYILRGISEPRCSECGEVI